MRELLGIIQFFFMLLVPVSAFATAPSLGSTLAAHSFADWAAVATVSTASGMVAFLNRVRKHMEAEALEKLGEMFNPKDRMLLGWKPFATFHMAGSYMSGLVVFFVGEHLDWGGYAEAIAIACAAWLGAQVMDLIANASTARIQEVANAAVGRKTEQ